MIDSSARELPGPRREVAGAWAQRRTLHVLLGLQSLLVVLVSVNRKGGMTGGFVAPNEFLRWVEINNLLLGLGSVVLIHLLMTHLHAACGRSPRRVHRVLDLAFVLAAYVYATGYAIHEIANYLHERFCSTDAGISCSIIIYNDDEFSHLLFFVGYIALNVLVMLAQVVSPDERPLTVRDNVLLVVNALFVAAAVAANLAFEEIGLDLYVVALVAAVALVLLWRHPRQAVLRYYAVAFVVGTIAPVVIIST